jgi:two-component system nitrogen regulation response regulator GlnG
MRNITIRKQRYRLALELQVIDDGPGVAEEIQDRIFNPLVSGREGGTGFGALARSDVRPLSPGRHRVRVQAGPDNVQDSAAATMKPVWIVDDDRSIRWVIEKALSREGIAYNSFASAQDALDALGASSPEVLVSDIRMPGRSGLELLQAVKQRHPGGAGDRHDRLLRSGQRGRRVPGRRLRVPAEAVRHRPGRRLIRRALDESRRETQASETPLEDKDILGQAPAMQEVFRAIGRLSQSSATVLITGESGTGKELVARALHRHSARASQPFVAINTAAMPKDLLESELFGHERGSFTGAQQQRRGRFEQAEGGTLFLDEIGDMPSELQTRLLRVLSDGTFYRVGGHQQIKVNVRVIAATHQNLEQRVREGTFREDLYHRLNVIACRLPSLRERSEGHSAARQAFPRHEREAARCRAQAHRRRCARPSRAPRVSRQRAPAGEPVPLADGDGAGAGDRSSPTCRRNSALRLRAMRRAPPTGSRRWSWKPSGASRAATPEFLDALGRQFERALISKALARTGGRRIDAANLLGMGTQHHHAQDPGTGHRGRKIGVRARFPRIRALKGNRALTPI